MFTLFNSKLHSSRVLFFTIDDTMAFTHFIYKQKVYLFDTESLQLLPKSFEALLFTPALDFSLSADDADDKLSIVDSLDGAVRYSRLPSVVLETLEEQFLALKKFPKFYPVHPVYRRLSQGFYFEIYSLPEVNKYAIFYFTRDTDLSPVGFQLLDNSSFEDLSNFLTGLAKQLPAGIDVFYFADTSLKGIEELFEAANSIQQVSTSLFTQPSLSTLESFYLQSLNASRKSFQLALVVISFAFIFFGFFAYKGYKYVQVENQIKHLEQQTKKLIAEQRQLDANFSKYSRYLPIYFAKEKQLHWKQLFLETSQLLPETTKIQSIALEKLASAFAWKYSIIIELPHFSVLFPELKKNLQKTKLLRTATVSVRYDNEQFTVELSGILRK